MVKEQVDQQVNEQRCSWSWRSEAEKQQSGFGREIRTFHLQESCSQFWTKILQQSFNSHFINLTGLRFSLSLFEKIKPWRKKAPSCGNYLHVSAEVRMQQMTNHDKLSSALLWHWRAKFHLREHVIAKLPRTKVSRFSFYIFLLNHDSVFHLATINKEQAPVVLQNRNICLIFKLFWMFVQVNIAVS